MVYYVNYIILIMYYVNYINYSREEIDFLGVTVRKK